MTLRAIPLVALLVTALGAAARAADAPPPPVEPALDAKLTAIDASVGKIKDFTARFEQRKHTALLRKPLVTSGAVRVLGSTIRWDTEKPEPSVMYSDGKELKMYYPRQKLAEVYAVAGPMKEMVTSPLPRLAFLKQNFAIESLPPDKLREDAGDLVDGPDRVTILMRPATAFMKEHLTEVRVLLDAKQAIMLCVVTVDRDGDRTVVRISDVKLDTGVKPGELDLTLPPDTKISKPLEANAAGK